MQIRIIFIGIFFLAFLHRDVATFTSSVEFWTTSSAIE